MNRHTGIALALALVCALTWTLIGASSLMAQSKQSERDPERDRLREMMMGNYESLMRVMFELSERKYAEAAEDVKAIQEHADAIVASGSQRDTLFHSYARSLSAHAENLRALALQLAGGSSATTGVRQPELEFMHDVIASDFGEMAATCVACHGHFLPKR